MNTVNIEPYLPQLQSAFEQHDVSLAYLFGSQAKGNVRPDSDLDIAVLFNNPWEGNSLWEGNPFPDRWEGNPFPDRWEGNPFPDIQANPPQTLEQPVGEASLPRLSNPKPPTHVKLHLAMIDIFHRDDVDLVVLNDAPNLLACAVLCYGKILYNRDDRLRVQFQVQTLQLYQEYEPMRRLFRESLSDRIRRGKFGKRSTFIPQFPKIEQTISSPTQGDSNMTVSWEIIHERIEALDDYTAVLRRYQAMAFDEMAADIGTIWAIKHGLQLCIQCVIDVCNHLVAGLNLGTPATHDDTVELLVKNGILSDNLGTTLVKMFRFRNILVHDYIKVDLKIVYNTLQTELEDFARFSGQVLKFLEQNAT